MRKFRWVALLASLTAPSIAAAADGPIACIHAAASQGDLLAVMTAQAEAEVRALTEAESAAMERVSSHTSTCRTRHGWSDNQMLAALNYAFGQVTYDDSVRALVARGLASSLIEEVAAVLGADGVPLLVAGDDSPETLARVGEAVVGRLEAAGREAAPGSDEVMQAALQVGRGLAARDMRDQAVEAFSR